MSLTERQSLKDQPPGLPMYGSVNKHEDNRNVDYGTFGMRLQAKIPNPKSKQNQDNPTLHSLEVDV